MSNKCAGWIVAPIDTYNSNKFWDELVGVFQPFGVKYRFFAGGNVYMLGTSDWFLLWEGEAELSPTYKPTFDSVGCWESFNLVNCNIL